MINERLNFKQTAEIARLRAELAQEQQAHAATKAAAERVLDQELDAAQTDDFVLVHGEAFRALDAAVARTGPRAET